MDPKEKAAYLLEKGYISNEDAGALFRLADKIEAVAEASQQKETTHISSSVTNIEYSHAQFKLGIDKIAQQIRDSRWEPDLIVGIVRGGAVPATYLSHKLNVPVQMVKWSTRDNTDGNESNCWIPEDIMTGKNVLIVEDIVDSGLTIKELLDDWNSSIRDELNLDFIRVAAMVYNTAQDVNVDYYDIAIDRNVDKRWVIFDWEG